MTNQASSRSSVSVEAVEELVARMIRESREWRSIADFNATDRALAIGKVMSLDLFVAELRALLPAQSPPAVSLEGVTIGGEKPELHSFGGHWHLQSPRVYGSYALQSDGSWGSHLSRQDFADEQAAIAHCLAHRDQPASGAETGGEQSESPRDMKVAHLCKGKSYRNYTRHWCSCCHPDQESVDLSLPELCAVANKTLAPQPATHELPTGPLGECTKLFAPWKVIYPHLATVVDLALEQVATLQQALEAELAERAEVIVGGPGVVLTQGWWLKRNPRGQWTYPFEVKISGGVQTGLESTYMRIPSPDRLPSSAPSEKAALQEPGKSLTLDEFRKKHQLYYDEQEQR